MKTNKGKKPQETESKKMKKTDQSQTQTPEKTSSGRIWLLVGGGCVLLFFAIVIITVTAVFGYS